MILDKKVEITWNSKNKAYFINKRYVFTKYGDSFYVCINDLTRVTNKAIMVNVVCDLCGKKRLKSYQYNDLDAGNQHLCKTCGLKKSAKKKYTIENIRSEFDDRGYRLISDIYENVTTKLNYICLKHEHLGVLKISYSKFLQGQGCNKCGREKMGDLQRYTLDKVRHIFSDKNCTLLSTYYENQNTDLTYYCNRHTELGILKTNLKIFSGSERGCRQCFIDSQFYTFDDVQKKFHEHNLILVSEIYVKNDVDLMFICPQHEKEGIQNLPFSEIMRGRGCKHCGKARGIQKTTGENHYNWKGGIYDEERDRFRRSYKVKQWRNAVYKRDGFTCQCCGQLRGKINAHHLDGYNWCEERRTDVSNGITLCESCHYRDTNSFHRMYGTGENTLSQFIEWIKKYGTLEEQRGTFLYSILNSEIEATS